MRGLPSPLAGAAAGLLGAVALLAVGAPVRELLRVPVLPEVLSEWATFYVPFEVFEYMINTFREGAKQMLALGMIALVGLVGLVVGLVYARWPRPRVAVGLALMLWLFTLAVVLPASGLGFFGSELRAGALAAAAGYLVAWAAFAVVLALVYWLLVPSRRVRRAGGAPSADAPQPPLAEEVTR